MVCVNVYMCMYMYAHIKCVVGVGESEKKGTVQTIIRMSPSRLFAKLSSKEDQTILGRDYMCIAL